MVACPSCGEENPERFRLCGFCGTPLAPAAVPREERRTVTIVFSDLQGSTRLGEALDPESIREVMSRYFEAMTDVLRRHGGTIEKFIGDAIMAVFGLPRVHEDDALRAVRAAHETQAALAALNVELEARYGIRLTNRTGVNTGEVVTGDAASAQRLVTGDTVNTAARLEQAAGPNEVLIGALTWRLVRDAVEVEPAEPLALKGKAEPVMAYRLMRVRGEAEGAARPGDQPMVGRAAELDILRGAWEDGVGEARALLVTVIGDAGVGKSRLISEFVGGLAQTAVLRGRCLSYGDGITFWPVVEAVREAAGIGADDTPDGGRRKLASLTADADVTDRLASILGFAAEPYSVDELFWAVRRWLEQLAADRGAVVWLIDDLHWAQDTFLALLTHLVDTMVGQPVLLLSTARHDLLDREPDWATRDRSRRIVLQPLTDTDAEQVIANRLGSAGIPPAVRDRVVRAAEGNPLFVEQLLGMLVDSGTLRYAGNGWEVARDVADLAVPPTIQALLAARLDLLEREERAVVEPASVVGLEFSEAAVTALVPEHLRPRVPADLAAIARKQLIHAGRTTSLDDDGYRFHHILIRDAAYQNLLKRSRAELHERFVDWVDQVNRERERGAEYEEILAYHLEQAYRYLSELGPLDDHGRGLRARAASRLGSAGRLAMMRGDMPAAVGLLRRAITVLDDATASVDYLVDLGEALMELGSFAEADEVLRRAHDAALAGDDRRPAAKAELVRLAATLYAGGGTDWSDRVERAVADAELLFERADDQDGMALAWRLRYGASAVAMQFGQAASAADRVVRHARAAANRRYETRGAAAYAQAALLGPVPVREAIRRCHDLLGEVASDRRTAALIGGTLAGLTAMDGRIAEARRLHSEAAAQLRELGAGIVAASSSIDSARIELLAGDLAEAERLLRADHQALSAIGEQYLLSSVDALLARVLYELDRFDEAAELAHHVQRIAMDDDVEAQAMWRSVLGMLRGRDGRVDEGLRLASAAVDLHRGTDAPLRLAEALTALGEALRFAGRDQEARAAREEALALYERKGDVVSAGRVRTLLS